jgi:ATP-dependent DNA ligase
LARCNRALVLYSSPTRKGNELLHYFPEIAQDLAKVPDIVIDGSLVILNDEGKPEFHQLRGRCANAPVGGRAAATTDKSLSALRGL